MPVKYQVITANDVAEMQFRTENMVAEGYIPVGSIVCGTRNEEIEHNIKGAIIVSRPYLKQSFWYAPNVDSALIDCVKQRELLESVVENAQCSITYEDIEEERCAIEIDRDIVDVIEAHLRGDAE